MWSLDIYNGLSQVYSINICVIGRWKVAYPKITKQASCWITNGNNHICIEYYILHMHCQLTIWIKLVLVHKRYITPTTKNTKWTHIIRTDLLIANWFSTETCVVGAQKTYQREGSFEHQKHKLTLGRWKNASKNFVCLSRLLHTFAGIID